jgi:uncharacterized protein (DUF302 family)
MIASPTVAIDLPLEALIWEDGEGRIRVSYNSPEYLGAKAQYSRRTAQEYCRDGVPSAKGCRIIQQ